jgi:hypothetical protein
MTHSLIVRGFVAALAVASSAAFADTLPNSRYAEMMTFEQMDTNHDGVVSRDEFVAAAGKMFDMAAEHMGAKDRKMTPQNLQELRKSIGYGR